EFIMTSRSPAMAKDRAELLSTLYHGDSREFLDVVRTKAERHDFPGDIGFELRSRVFEQTALKYNDASDIIELARRIFTGDMWLRDLDTPQRTRSTIKMERLRPKIQKAKTARKVYQTIAAGFDAYDAKPVVSVLVSDALD